MFSLLPATGLQTWQLLLSQMQSMRHVLDCIEVEPAWTCSVGSHKKLSKQASAEESARLFLSIY
jgi:hypothetical protein